MIVGYRCACGIALRYDKDAKRYVPLAGSAAALEGHAVATLVEDGRARTVRSDAVCAAVADELAPRRERKRRGRRRSA